MPCSCTDWLAQSIRHRPVQARANPSLWGSAPLIPLFGEWWRSERPIAVSIPLRPRMSTKDPRRCGGPRRSNGTEQANATSDTENREEPGPRALPLGCALAPERPGAKGAQAAGADGPRPAEEGPRRPEKDRREPRVRDALLRGRRAVRGRGERSRAADRPVERRRRWLRRRTTTTTTTTVGSSADAEPAAAGGSRAQRVQAQPPSADARGSHAGTAPTTSQRRPPLQAQVTASNTERRRRPL